MTEKSEADIFESAWLEYRRRKAGESPDSGFPENPSFWRVFEYYDDECENAVQAHRYRRQDIEERHACDIEDAEKDFYQSMNDIRRRSAERLADFLGGHDTERKAE